MTVTELKENLCNDIVVGAFDRHDRKFIVTCFTYPAGESVNLYLEGDSNEQRLSDMGTTHYMLRVAGVDLDTEPRMEFVESICATHGLDLSEDWILSKSVNQGTAGTDVLAFCEAITRISTLHYDQRPKHNSMLAAEVESLIALKVPQNTWWRNWSDPVIDPSGMYPVDYHLNSIGEPRNIFVVPARLKAETTIGTINFYHSKQRYDKAMTIVAPGINLPKLVKKKLELVSRLTYGVLGNENAILEFSITR